MLRTPVSLTRPRILISSGVALALALTSGLLLAGQSSDAGESTPVEAAPIVELPARLGGAAALEELGGAQGEDLAKVALAHEMTPRDLARTLDEDPSLRIDTNGRLFYADDFGSAHAHGDDHASAHDEKLTDADLSSTDLVAGEMPDESAVADPEAYSTSGAEGGGPSPLRIAPLTDTFELHSFPGARGPTIFLDFDGHEFVAGDMWGLAGQQAHAWDPARDGAAFSDAELIRIQQIWARVAEHFSFAEINVTTQEPPASAFRDAVDPEGRQYALRVLVSPNITTVEVGTSVEVRVDPADPDQSRGGTIGLAYLGSAVRGDLWRYRETPALVFAGRMNGMSDAQFASTISHEAGHNFDYQHAFSPSDYQPIRRQGADSSAVHHLIMDYATPNGSGFFTAEERANLFTATASRRPVPYVAGMRNEDLDPTDGTVSGWLTGDAPADAFLLTGCDGDVRVRATAGAVGPTLDVALKVQEGTAWAAAAPVLAQSAPNTAVGTALRNAGVDADVTFTADPSKTYVVQVATSGSGTPAYYPAAYTYGRYAGSVEGCGAPVAAPTAPTDLTADLETVNGSFTRAALVSWGAPAHPGGEAPTYEVAVDGKRLRALDATTFSYRIAETPEAGARLRVRAVNSAGASPWVELVTPSWAPPQPPEHVSAMRIQLQQEDPLSGEPVFDGDGDPVLEWWVYLTVVHDRDFVTSSAAGSAAFWVPTGNSYAGYSLRSEMTAVLVPGADLPVGTAVAYEIRHPGHSSVLTWLTVRDRVEAPGQVRELAATLDGSDLDVSWKRPDDDGGAWPAYRVRLNGGDWITADRFGFAHTFADVPAAAEYRVDVMARHAGGSSMATQVVTPSSAVEPVPASKPRAVEIVEDSNGSTLRWDVPQRLRGQTVTSWRVTIGDQVVSVAEGSRRLALTGFRAGRTLEVTVAAVTSNGFVETVGEAATVRLGPAE